MLLGQESHRLPPKLEASSAEPSCKLTKKGVCFTFGDEQRRAFSELKSRLSSAETLGYFDKCFGCQLVSSKQSCSSWANQVNPLTTRSMARLGPGFIGSFSVMWRRVSRARCCDLWGRQCDQLLHSDDQIFTPGRLPGPQDRWLSSLGKHTLMIIRYPSEN